MAQKTISLFLLFLTFFSVTPSAVFAKASNDWEQVKALANTEIAVNTKDGKTVFGKMISATDTELVIQIAEKQGLSTQSTINKDSVKKLWKAKLNFEKGVNGKNVAISAGVGAGVGAGVAAGLLGATGGSDETGAIIAGFVALGAGAGAVLGLLWRSQKHKKLDLVYKV